MISAIDWGVIGVYLVGMVLFGLYLARKTSSGDDYYLGGRSIPPWIAALSIMATQTSTISLVGAPAFVAVKPGGGLRWLQYELALPVAMLLIMIFLVPTLWRSKVTTIYELLERRFGLPARLVLSAVFLLSRSAAAAVMIYATAVILQVATGAPVWLLISIIAIVCLVYSTLGGLVADVYTDAVQLFILWGSVLVSVGFAIAAIGHVGALTELEPARAKVLELSQHGLGDGGDYGFWPLLIGGMFLYVAYYGTDQTQVQRILGSPSVQGARQSLFLNGLLRFPLVLSYVIFGVALAALVGHDSTLLDAISVGASGQKAWDELVPRFIVTYLPTGVVGVMIAGMLAASMSSLDSTFNSLSASTMKDYVERSGWLRNATPKQYMRVARGITFAWGLLCSLLSFGVGGVSDTVIESVNKIGSVFYGPVLAVFLLAILTRFVGGSAAIAGLIAGTATNIYLWLAVPEVSWLWWNVIGLVVALGAAALLSLPSLLATRAAGVLVAPSLAAEGAPELDAFDDDAARTDAGLSAREADADAEQGGDGGSGGVSVDATTWAKEPVTRADRWRYGLLLGAFVFIFAVSWGLGRLFGAG